MLGAEVSVGFDPAVSRRLFPGGQPGGFPLSLFSRTRRSRWHGEAWHCPSASVGAMAGVDARRGGRRLHPQRGPEKPCDDRHSSLAERLVPRARVVDHPIESRQRGRCWRKLHSRHSRDSRAMGFFRPIPGRLDGDGALPGDDLPPRPEHARVDDMRLASWDTVSSAAGLAGNPGDGRRALNFGVVARKGFMGE